MTTLHVPRIALLMFATLMSTLPEPRPGPQVAADEATIDFDVRWQGDRVAVSVQAAVTAAREGARGEARAATLAALRAEVDALVVDDHDLFGTPHFVRSTQQLLTDPVTGPFTPVGVTIDFVTRHRDLFEVDGAELSAARVTRNYVTRHNGITHLTWQQQIDGLDVDGAEFRANVTAAGELVTVSSTLLPRPEGGFSWPVPTLSAKDALARAAADVGLELTAPLVPTGRATDHNEAQQWQPGTDFRDDIPVSTERILFPLTCADLQPAWFVVVPEPGVGNTWEITVDAVDGTILRRKNRMRTLFGGTENASYNVFPIDSPGPGSPGAASPNGFQFPFVNRTLITQGATASSPQGWIPDGDNETLGNNVDAHTDLDSDNQPDLPRPQGSPYRVFDFPYDPASDPALYPEAAVVQAFWALNNIHDRLYALGFDEAAGNFQTDNFGLGGTGGDAVRVEVQDGAGTNNANWNGNGSDGSTTRIQMFLFDGANPDRDSAFDTELLYHEYIHGLSTRLNGGNMFLGQSGAMGEGWGDYFGISMNAEAGDDPDGIYPYSAWSTLDYNDSDNNYYWGIRRYPYTTDMSRSPMTYADADPGQIEYPAGIPVFEWLMGIGADEVHNAGEIWCSMLLECRALLWRELGFAGNERMMQLVVDGMKLMPMNPSYIQVRDAILAADLAGYGGANAPALWGGFARRGLGLSATTVFAGNFSDVGEAFDTPQLMQFSYPDGKPDQLLPGQTTTFAVEIAGLLGNAPRPGTGELSYSVNESALTTVPMTPTGTNTYAAELPPGTCLDEVSWFVSVDSMAGVISDPVTAPVDSSTSIAYWSAIVFGDHDFESQAGWSVGAAGDDATAGLWVRGDPFGTDAQPEDDHSDTGSQCFFTGQGVFGSGSNTAADVDGGTTTLVSPVYDLSGGDAEVSYWRWYSNAEGASPGTDVFVVEISNGGAWTVAETVGPSGAETEGGWIFHKFNVSDIVTPSANVRLRFVASDEGSASVVEAAVDDVRVRRLLCDEPCQNDLGFAGPGNLTLSLCGPPMATGASNDLDITGAPPFAPIFLLLSLSSNPTPFEGGMLVPIPILTVLNFAADGAGEFHVTAPGGNGPLTLYMQAVAPDSSLSFGYAMSNALEVVLAP